jgi:hypothetical protein
LVRVPTNHEALFRTTCFTVVIFVELMVVLTYP